MAPASSLPELEFSAVFCPFDSNSFKFLLHYEHDAYRYKLLVEEEVTFANVGNYDEIQKYKRYQHLRSPLLVQCI